MATTTAEKLMKRKKEVLLVLDHLKKEGAEATGVHHFDWLDKAWDENAARTLDRLTELYRSELAGIERALGRLSAGSFGTCLACHKPIEMSRLELFPQTEFCRNCREFREAFENEAR